MPIDNGMSMDGYQEQMPMDDPNMMDNQMMGSQGNMENGSEEEPMSNNGDDGESQFDTNFDAGVEADEETDPKRYIQQLTGKLSTTLNSFNNENGEPDEGLCKYVGKMIVKQAAKGLDEKGKKELIAAINTADSDTDEDDLETEDDMSVEDGNEVPETDNGSDKIMEYAITKKQVLKLSESLNQIAGDEEDKRRGCISSKNKKQKHNTTFSGKKF